MESKNVKVIDEHGIDRSGNVIFSIDVDGSDYVVYWIERDSENDNIFVSKLLKNIDGTSNMINIEDSMEKGKISDIVKELIKYSIDNENDKLFGNSVLLPSGKTVVLSSVIINKEQYINVQKTYITTVKKSVVKVTSEYYDVKIKNDIMEDNVSEIFPVNQSTDINQNESIIPEITPLMTNDVKMVVPTQPEVKVSPIEDTPQVVPEVSSIPTPVASEPTVTPISNDVIPNVIEPIVEVSEVAPVIPKVLEPVVSEPRVEQNSNDTILNTVESNSSLVESNEKTIPSALVFDASKETNLNIALGEASQESTIPVENVGLIREFGEDTSNDETKNFEKAEVINAPQIVSPDSNQKAGFASNKFFMFVAIAFFFASCIFLGYEVYRYFQLS